MPARILVGSLFLALVAAAVGCGSKTDITRRDDEVDEWVEQQRAEEAEREQQSPLGSGSSSPPPARGAPPAAPAPIANDAGAGQPPATDG